MQQVCDYRNEAEKFSKEAKKNAESIDKSMLVKKSGDTIKALTISDGNNSCLRLTNSVGQIWQFRTYTDGSLGFDRYNPETKTWNMYLRYVEPTKTWRFESIENVTINGKSALKVGDAMRLFDNLAETNINKLNGLSEGFYFQNVNTLATSQNGYSINEAGDLKVTQNDAEGKDDCCQIYTTYRNARQFIRNYRPVSKTWEAWTEQITTRNSTIDSNGFYKKASPILRLYGTENIENVDGVTSAGCGLVNDLAKGVTAKRIDVGHYEISGSLGFSKEGWYITLPEDANGNKKIFAEYSVDDNNVITIKTYTRKFSAKQCEIIAGDPIDITDDRWIDVRLEMPVVSSSTIEIIEEEEPSLDVQEKVESIL